LIKSIEEQIVVTTTKTPKLYAETPIKTEVITQTEIKQKVAVNLAESFTLTPGVRVEMIVRIAISPRSELTAWKANTPRF